MQLLRFISKTSALASLLYLVTVNANALTPPTESNAESVKIEIPVIKNARIFAQFDDKAPAVVNYFSSETEQTIIKFYQEHYGEAIKQERKRGRLTLNYTADKQQIRVVISQQNKLRQVDVIVDNTAQ